MGKENKMKIIEIENKEFKRRLEFIDSGFIKLVNAYAYKAYESAQLNAFFTMLTPEEQMQVIKNALIK
jgi:hypothetical protein